MGAGQIGIFDNRNLYTGLRLFYHWLWVGVVRVEGRGEGGPQRWLNIKNRSYLSQRRLLITPINLGVYGKNDRAEQKNHTDEGNRGDQIDGGLR